LRRERKGVRGEERVASLSEEMTSQGDVARDDVAGRERKGQG